MFIAARRVGRYGALALVLAGTSFASACSSSGGDAAAPVTTSTSPATVVEPSGSDVAADGGDPSEIEQGLAEAGLGSKGEGIVYAMKADRYEIVGDELHVYLGDRTSVPEGTECMIATAVLSPGERVVIHKDDTVTPCD
jgi:hypothetical protein